MMYEVTLRQPYYVQSFRADDHPISAWLLENVNKVNKRHSLVTKGRVVTGVLFDDFSDALLFTLVFPNNVMSGIKEVVAYK